MKDERKERKRSITLMVEPHFLAAQFLRTILRSRATHDLPVSCKSPRKGKKRVTADVIIVDSETIKTPLSKLLRSLRLEFPKAKILVLGRPLSADEVCHLLMLQVHGYLAYEEARHRLRSAIDAVRAGSLWVPRDVLENFVRYSARLNQSRTLGQQSLTLREAMVVDLLQRGMSNKEIGTALGISERTAKFHLSNIFAKRGVHDRHSAVLIAKSEKPLVAPSARQ